MSEYNHDELKRILEKITLAIRSFEDVTILESLLACELVNSRLLIPASARGDDILVNTVTDEKGRVCIPLFTEEEEFSEDIEHLDLARKPFKEILELVDDRVDAIIINPFKGNYAIERRFLERYFEVEDEY